MKNLQLLGEIIGVLDRNGFHLHASQMQASVDRGSVTEQQAATIVGSIRGVVFQPARAPGETPSPIPPTNQPTEEPVPASIGESNTGSNAS